MRGEEGFPERGRGGGGNEVRGLSRGRSRSRRGRRGFRSGQGRGSGRGEMRIKRERNETFLQFVVTFLRQIFISGKC